MDNVKAFQKSLDFLRRMHWHLQFTPDTNKHSVIAYQVALQALEQHQTLEGVEAVKGIGAKMLEHFQTIAQGKIPKRLREIEGNGPPFTVSELTAIPGVGIKTAEKLYIEHGVKSLEDLDKKIKSHKITDPKLVAAYLDHGAVNERIPRTVIAQNIAPVLKAIEKVLGVGVEMEMVGSFRRHRADIRDVDVLIGTDGVDVIKSVVAVAKTFADSVRLVDKEGLKKAEVQILIAGRQRKLDLYFVEPRCWGSALMHFTGPAKYNVSIREAAKKRGLKVSQYGVTNTRTNKIKRFHEEGGMCKYLGIPYLDPELRDLGADLKQVKSNELESLLTMKSVKGDFHVHTTESDGKSSVEALVKHLLVSRFKYLGISNHSQGTGGGMTGEQCLNHHNWIRSFIRKTKYKKNGVDKHARALCGAEVDVNVDGVLDYDSKTLKTLDYVILAIHHKPDFKPTERLLQALETVHKLGVPAIIAHPTNRIIGYRPESMVTWNPVFMKCAEYGVALEVNGQGDRLDLPEQLIERARKFGCWFVVSSDFHGSDPVDRVKLLEQAVMQARRGWLTADSVVNANNKHLAKWLGAKRYTAVFEKER